MVNILRLSTRIDINTFMTSVRTALLAGVLLFITNFSIAQRDKEGSYVAPGANTVVNTYTYLTVNAAAGTNTLTVNNNSMNGGVFGGALAPGDLVMIIQMQGASTDINTTPTTAWGGNYTIPNSYLTTWGVNPENFGGVTNYNQSGYHERREVLSVSGGNSITLNCNLSYSYSASTAGISGHVQVVRIPRFTDLTVNTGTSIVPTLWDGNSGGIVALEVNGALTVNAGGSISASGYGFRGGELDASSLTATFETTSVRHLGSNDNLQGSEKGEGIGGYHVEYDALASRYGIGAVANGGGGGGYQNTGGGGGTNVMVGGGAYTGKGIPQGVPAVLDLEIFFGEETHARQMVVSEVIHFHLLLIEFGLAAAVEPVIKIVMKAVLVDVVEELFLCTSMVPLQAQERSKLMEKMVKIAILLVLLQSLRIRQLVTTVLVVAVAAEQFKLKIFSHFRRVCF
jgi:hypothetical protein